METKPRPKGLVTIDTGDGIGKTTALGEIMCSWGCRFRVCMIQFIKSATASTGEVKAVKKLGIEWQKSDDGSTWCSKDLDETTTLALDGWELAQEKISSGNYNLVVLDEFTYSLHHGWLGTSEVRVCLSANKHLQMHLVITWPSDPRVLIEYADIVTENKLIKHPYSQGLKAQAGVEF